MQDDFASTFVVEGFVSNKPGDSEITLSRSGLFQRNVFDWISNAELVVVENETLEHNFAYQKDGLYKPVQEDYSAKMGSSYRLKIVLEGQEYESGPVTMPSSLDIDSIYYKPSEDLIENPRLEVLLTSSSDEHASRFYMYSFEETWKAVAIHSRDKIIKPIFTYDEYRNPINIDFETVYEGNTTNCWPYKKVVRLNVTSTEGLSRNQILNMPIFIVSLESSRLLYRYSVLVNQYAVGKEVHHFFSMLKEFSENSGFLYDTQPGYIEGNIQNKSAPEDKVTGIFYAASHKSSRIFISNSELPGRARATVARYNQSCNFHNLGGEGELPISVIPNAPLTEGLQYLKDSLIRGKGYKILDHYTFEENGETFLELHLTNGYCLDCRYSGSNIKPTWWD